MLAVWYPFSLQNQPTEPCSDLVMYAVTIVAAFALGVFCGGRRRL